MPRDAITIRRGEFTDNIACPNCENDYLHHSKVHVYSRTSEDNPGIHAVTGEGAVHTVDTDMRKNPSRRRDGIRIEFWCEICDGKPVLEIAQHKGTTYIHWAE